MNAASRLALIERMLRPQPDQRLEFLARRDQIRRILELRDEKDALILGHNYMIPLVYQLSDEAARGDSLALSRYAAQAENPIILFNGVVFMAETAKILNPAKKVLIADSTAGCSLADGFTAGDVRGYRDEFPDAPVVTYVNSYAEVKAESDYCCTSANVMQIVEHAAHDGNGRVIFLPDTLMGRNVEKELRRKGSAIELIYPGKHDARFARCEVHEKFTREQLRLLRRQFNLPKGSTDSAILAHWECSPEVLEEADFHGSTSEMAAHISTHPQLARVYLATECEMASNLESEFPQVNFVKTCAVYCQHMRKITLDKILSTLETESPEVHVPEETRIRALGSIQRMLSIAGGRLAAA
jgi:quinolinate synthase